MTIKIGINGFGRIGRCVARALEASKSHDVTLTHINDLCDIQLSAHLLRHDTTHGNFAGTVEPDGDALLINGNKVGYSMERNIAELPWGKLGVDVVMECTGIFATRDKADGHLDAGAGKVLVSAPCSNADATIVYGINHQILDASHKVVSNASCTTNCLAPVAKVLEDKIGIVSGLMSTVHAYTNDQVTLDGPHKDYRRARTAATSIIPTKTGAASAIGLVIPKLNGKMSGMALRVPVNNVSLVDLTFVASRPTSVEEINAEMKQAAQGELAGILQYEDKPLVSADFNGNPASSIFDSLETSIDAGKTHAKVLSWYDNEWGFSNRMLDTAVALAKAGR